MALAGKATMGAMGLGPALGNLYEVRNQALLAEGMGLGEYSYIYLTAYQSQLTDDGPRTGIMDGSPISRRLHGCVGDMLSTAARIGPQWRRRSSVADGLGEGAGRDGIRTTATPLE